MAAVRRRSPSSCRDSRTAVARALQGLPSRRVRKTRPQATARLRSRRSRIGRAGGGCGADIASALGSAVPARDTQCGCSRTVTPQQPEILLDPRGNARAAATDRRRARRAHRSRRRADAVAPPAADGARTDRRHRHRADHHRTDHALRAPKEYASDETVQDARARVRVRAGLDGAGASAGETGAAAAAKAGDADRTPRRR